jgi:hypothetical protein
LALLAPYEGGIVTRWVPRVAILISSLLLLPLVSFVADRASSPARRDEVWATLRRLPLYFIENRGEMASRAEYYVHGAEASMLFTSGGLRLSLSHPSGRHWALGVGFVGAHPTEPVGLEKTPAVISYFRGEPERWRTGNPTYSRVAYRDLWPGIDLFYSGTGSRLKYSFVVRPGADPSQIRLAYRGATRLAVNAQGQLEVTAPAGKVVEDVPLTYQGTGERRERVPSSYSVGNGRAYGFDVSPYDRSRPLVIDPVMLINAGYIGGSGGDSGEEIDVDSTGAVYVTGTTPSSETTFPDGDGFGTLMGPDTFYNGNNDAFVAKVAPSGTSLVYAGYIGGSGAEQGKSIAVDGAGAAYVTGVTGSTEATFPVVVGPDTTHNGMFFDAFVVKVAPSGTSLEYAGYIGGAGDQDFGSGIAVDGTGAAYLIGSTDSTEASFPDGDGLPPLPGPDPSYNGSGDAFVAKVAPSGASLEYAGYIGGNAGESGSGIAVDGAGAAYVTGSTGSTQITFPAAVGPDTSYNGGSNDAFVAKVVPAGTSLDYAGYVGGVGDFDHGFGIARDGTGAAYLTGTTDSTEVSFPDGDGFGSVPGPDPSYNGGLGDAFVAKVASSGTTLAYAGYVGGAGYEGGQDIAVDGTGGASLVGDTDSTQASFPDGDGLGTVTGPDTSYNGGLSDAFVANVAPSGTSLGYAGFIGGSGTDVGQGIAVDGGGAAYLTGYTESDQTSFPDGDGFGAVTGPDTSHNGGTDAFVATVADVVPPSPSPQATCKGTVATVVGTEGADALSGTNGADVIAALGGNDTVKAVGGKDLVCGSRGNDRVNGGGGKDKVNGQRGRDTLKGAGGNDRLNGGPKKDTCVGGPGKDRARGCEKKRTIP